MNVLQVHLCLRLGISVIVIIIVIIIGTVKTMAIPDPCPFGLWSSGRADVGGQL